MPYSVVKFRQRPPAGSKRQNVQSGQAIQRREIKTKMGCVHGCNSLVEFASKSVVFCSVNIAYVWQEPKTGKKFEKLLSLVFKNIQQKEVEMPFRCIIFTKGKHITFDCKIVVILLTKIRLKLI